MSESVIEALQRALREFATQRGWEKYHTPKNLVMALTGEVGELADLFQWLTEDESIRITHHFGKRADVESELADVFQSLLRLADVLDVDLENVTWQAIERNKRRFPIEDSRRSTFSLTPSVDEIVARLSDSSLAEDPRSFPANREVATKSGMYAWWASEEARALLSSRLETEIPPLVYAGQAGATKWPSGAKSAATLRSRILQQHIKGNARSSTFRHTLSAVLLEPLGLAIGEGRRLTLESEAIVTKWICEHLRVNVVPVEDPDQLGKIEESVLIRLDPPLNIEGLPSNPVRQRLQSLRRSLTSR